MTGLSVTVLDVPATDAQRDHGFATDGYAVLEGFLDPGLVGRLRGEVDAALRRTVIGSCARPHNLLAPLRWDDPIVELVAADAERRRALADRTAGDDLRWISGYVSVKNPETPPLWWHQDWWCWDHPVSLRPAAVQVALLCYLSDTDERSGALRVLPGSHLASVPVHALLPAAHEHQQGLSLDDPVFQDQPDQLTIAVRAGDAVVIDYRLLHSTHANQVRARRDCVLLSFTPSWRTLPVDIRAHLIRHLAQPTDSEQPQLNGWAAELLPHFTGRPADLTLNRRAPADFAVRR